MDHRARNHSRNYTRIGDSESNGRKVTPFHKYAIIVSLGPRSIATHCLVTGICTPPPYSSSKTINEALGVNARSFRHGVLRSRYGIVPESFHHFLNRSPDFLALHPLARIESPEISASAFINFAEARLINNCNDHSYFTFHYPSFLLALLFFYTVCQILIS